ncbi:MULTISPECIES: holo-ACP synthase [Atopobiaceae]|uniref:holo-ACP synthase n=1 Tax=Atopobiaceae TaxID=1643824 RepID=UPI000B36B210|nr:MULTISPECIES: holo-ACP synthase [Atopobiaceae]MCR8907298.1 holo-ACP synthase [Thermophilibacter sp. ET337]OUO33809.1 holo-[acyl-carrier-protein] synthase [Olsenella sp. An293]
MVRGIGIDSVDIEEMARLVADERGAFARRTFTEAERAQAFSRHDAAACLAGKFAVKEAVFKALARHTAEGFDFRRVETLEDESGCPHVTLDGPLAPVLAEAGVSELLVSITNERGVATAVVLAQ